jgi:glutamate carboxypeptidase
MPIDPTILNFIHTRREEMLVFLEQLVAMESPSADGALVGEVADALEHAFRRAGCSTERIPAEGFAPHLVADSPGNPRGPRILLVGHCDTVFSAGTLPTMPIRREGDRLLGPGVMDMKGGLVVALYALQAVLSARSNLLGSVRVAINTDEEPGSPTSRSLWPELAKDTDWAFVFEPALEDGSLIDRRKGVGVFRLKVCGRSAHAGAEPEKGANAIVALSKKIISLAALTDFAVGTTVNAGVISGGTLPYVVPDGAEAKIDIRVPNAAEKDRITALVRNIAEREDVPGTSCSLEGSFHRPSMDPTEPTERLKRLIEAEAPSVNLDVRWAACGSVSDANNVAALGIPTIDGMGPAGGGAHSPDEWMDIPSFFQKTALLAAVLDRIVGREALWSR